MEGGQQVVYRTVAFQQVHIFHTAEFAFQRGGKNNDWDFRPLVTQRLCHFSAELSRTQMVIEYGYINVF